MKFLDLLTKLENKQYANDCIVMSMSMGAKNNVKEARTSTS